MPLGSPHIITHWTGTYVITSDAAVAASAAERQAAEHVLFVLRHAFTNNDAAVVAALGRLHPTLSGGPLPQFRAHDGLSSAPNAPPTASPHASTQSEQLWTAFERAVRAGRLGVTKLERTLVKIDRLEPPAQAVLGPREEQETFFEATIVDEIGEPIAGLDLLLSCEGRTYDLTTNGAGKVRQDGVHASRASLRVKDEQQLRTIVEPRWDAPRPGAFPQALHLFRTPLLDQLQSFSLAAEDEHLIVITPPLATLHVELWDRRGRKRHIDCDYQIDGPMSFSGKTDANGQLLHPDVLPGDYTLTLTVEHFKDKDYAVTETYTSPVVALVSGGPQIRWLGPTPLVTFSRIRGFLFDTNKTFLLPTAKHALESVRELWESHDPSHLLIVGHTDSTGEPSVNDPLSLARAESVKAYLTDDVDTWLSNYDQSGAGKWGAREDRLMMSALPDFALRDQTAGETGVSGGNGEDRSSAEDSIVHWFQRTRELTVDGKAGPQTRRALITEYMSLDGTSLSEDENFQISITTHGAGEHFPLNDTGLELDTRAASARNNENDQLDRRVELFFFDDEFGILPAPGAAGGPEYLEWRARADENHDTHIEPDLRQVTFLELHDALFRTNSCVVLPEGEAPIGSASGAGSAGSGGSDSGPHTALSSVGLFAAAIRFCDERPNYKVFIGGHTDSVGGDEANQALSTERAQVALAMLTGDRDGYASLVDARHKVSDYKQILSWCCQAFAEVVFSCDPGTIDDVAATGVNAVKTFQAEYNDQRALLGVPDAPELTVDGDVGPKTWGALFDVMQYGIAVELGEEVADVAALRDNIQWVDDSRQALGFGEHHPIDGRGLNNYKSQSNRRVEVMFFEYGHEPDLAVAEAAPELCEVYFPGEYGHEPITVGPSFARGTLRLRTLDVMGLPVRGAVVEVMGSTTGSKISNSSGVACFLPPEGNLAVEILVSAIDESKLPRNAGQPSFPNTWTAFSLAKGVSIAAQPEVDVVVALLDVELTVDDALVSSPGRTARFFTGDGSYDCTLALPPATEQARFSPVMFDSVPSQDKTYSLQVSSGEYQNSLFEGLSLEQLIDHVSAATAALVQPEPNPEKRTESLRRLDESDG